MIEGDDGPPKLVALDGEKLYTMTLGDVGEDSLSGHRDVPPGSRSTPTRRRSSSPGKFSGHRGPNPMSRQTTWTFNLGQERLTFSTKFSEGQARMRGQDEGAALRSSRRRSGWTQLPGQQPPPDPRRRGSPDGSRQYDLGMVTPAGDPRHSKLPGCHNEHPSHPVTIFLGSMPALERVTQRVTMGEAW